MTSPNTGVDVNPEPTLSEWLLGQLAEDDRLARAMSEVFPPPWDLYDRGHSARVMADGPNFLDVTQIDQSQVPAGDNWPGDFIAHVARHDPARVLVKVAAKRQLVELHCPSRNYIDEMGSHTPADGEILVCASCGDQGQDENEVVAPCPTLRLLALPYAGRPGYREQWRP